MHRVILSYDYCSGSDGGREGYIGEGGLRLGATIFSASPMRVFLSSSFCPNKKNLPPEGDTVKVTPKGRVDGKRVRIATSLLRRSSQ